MQPDVKPRLFIGSSTEALPIAKFVKDSLNDVAECIIWNEKVFGINKSYFDTLLEVPNLNDYAILIASKDDKTESKSKMFESPRDNVIFEFGLFLGRLGKRKVFIIEEEGVKLPSDIYGIEIPKFTRGAKQVNSKSLVACCERLKEEITKKEDVFIYTLLPSTALAQGYFNNFVKQVCQGLKSSHTIWLKEKKDEGSQDIKQDTRLKEWQKFELVIAV